MCVRVVVDNTEGRTSPVRRSGSAERLTNGTSRSRSTSPLRPRAAAAAAAAAGGGGVTSLSSINVDPVSVQMALRNFSKQLVTAEKDRVSNIHS